MNNLSTLASLASVLLSLVAAGLWILSATVNLPMAVSPFGTIENLHSFYAGMRKVSRLNAGAAFCAFASATAQALALYVSTHLA
jgi:hypothetical protein